MTNTEKSFPQEKDLCDPISKEYVKFLDVWKKTFIILFVIAMLIYVVGTIFILVNENNDDTSIEIHNFFSMIIEYDGRYSICGTPFVKFLTFTVSYFFYCIVAFGVLALLGITAETKMHIMNNTYKTAVLLERQLKTCDIRFESKAINVTKEEVSPVDKFLSISNNTIVCPVCGTKQNADSTICSKCGYKFINEQNNVPYRCAKCGHNGPYENYCPECGSSMKKYNN